jgi:hypothetical protein
LSFEQHCDGSASALRGDIHWTSADTTSPPGPTNPAPGDLWEANSDVLPPTGNYIYLESETGDYIGRGGIYLYTPLDTQISVRVIEGHLSVATSGAEDWRGDFKTMDFLDQLEVGYYGDLQRYPFHNPVKGGLSWSGQGRCCNSLTGWFFVDSVTYVGTDLTAIDLRFEQHCEGAAPALHGKIHWGS